MHKPESVLENETHKVLCCFEIQTNHLISTKKTDLMIVNKKKRTCRQLDFAVPVDKKKRKVFRFCQRTKKTVK